MAGTWLVREVTGTTTCTTSVDLRSATLADAARLVEVDLASEFDVGHDTPALGATTRPLGVDPDVAAAVAEWFAFGWVTLDRALTGLGAWAEASVVQLWPEHFDVGCDVAASPGRRVNLGASPGDTFSAEPYLYVGPWDSARPGDAAFWNAPFGAVLGHQVLRATGDPVTAGVDFLLQGVELLR